MSGGLVPPLSSCFTVRSEQPASSHDKGCGRKRGGRAAVAVVFSGAVGGRGVSGDFLCFAFKKYFMGFVKEREVVCVMDPQG